MISVGGSANRSSHSLRDSVAFDDHQLTAASPSSPAARAASAAASPSCWPSAARRSASRTANEQAAGEAVDGIRGARRPGLGGRVRRRRVRPRSTAFFEARRAGARPGRHPGQQRRHHARRARHVRSTPRAGTRCCRSTCRAHSTAAGRWSAACCCEAGAGSSTSPRPARACRSRARAATRRRRPASKDSRGRCHAIWRGKGVLVNAVSPGLIETEMLEAMPAERREALPQGRADRARRARRARWPRSSRSWPPTRPPTSPARSSASTAACCDTGAYG